MKPYFGKQVIERERHGSSFRSLKARHYGKIDEDGDFDGPVRIPMSRHAVDRFNRKMESKDFTDVLGPVRGYLFSKVGCRWDDVYSELSRELGSGSEPMAHILYVHILDRRTKTLDFYRAGNQFYVDDNGLLQWKVDSWRHRWPKKKEPVRSIQKEDGEWFVEIKGLWYLGRFEEDKYFFPEIIWGSRTSTAIRAEEWPSYRTGWGKDAKKFRFLVRKQANKKELIQKNKLLGFSA